MDRAYSVLNVKSVDETRRIIRGIATTPSTDRQGDIIEPLGVKFRNPSPLLWQHQADKPVGLVTFDVATAKGIGFTAELPVINDAGVLKDRVDEAWQSIKAGLVAAVSIGFRVLEDGAEALKSGGIRFTKSEVLELSLVTIPANAQATITQIKSLDEIQRAATGQALQIVAKLEPPGASGTTKSQPAASGLFVVPKKGTPIMKTIQEQIAALEQQLTVKSTRMSDVMAKGLDENRSTDAAEAEEFDTLEGDVERIKSDLGRLRKLEKLNIGKATAVTGDNTSTVTKAADVRGGVIAVKSNLPKGTGFTRYVQALARAKGNLMQAAEIAKSYEDTTPEVGIVLKSAVAAGTTTDANWAAPLVPYQQMSSEFIELLRPRTVLGKIPGIRMVPFNIKMPTQTGGSTVSWVGQLAPKPVSSLAFGNLTLDFTKTAGIVVISDELARLSTPSAEALIRNDLIEQTAQFLDQSFLDPSKAAVPGVSPASITNGATAITASGTSADALRADLRALFAAMTAQNLSSAGTVFIMTETQATAISMIINGLGQPEFPMINALGGMLFGIPVVTTENVPQVNVAAAGAVAAYQTAPIILVKATEILLADDGQVAIDVSKEASLQMDSAPTNPPTASTVMVSLWQMNMVGIRAERWINWIRRRPGAVAYISAANYA